MNKRRMPEIVLISALGILLITGNAFTSEGDTRHNQENPGEHAGYNHHGGHTDLKMLKHGRKGLKDRNGTHGRSLMLSSKPWISSKTRSLQISAPPLAISLSGLPGLCRKAGSTALTSKKVWWIICILA